MCKVMKIAIVDDERIWLEKIHNYVKQYFAKMEVLVKSFSSGEGFLNSRDDYQIVFMDIEMPGQDGFSVLQEYRKNHDVSLFIILTTHIEMSRQGYKVEAFRYIDKYEMDEIEEALDSAMLKLESFQMMDVPLISHEMLQIQRYQVLYFEVYGHDILMHTQNGETFRCKETLKELTDRLTDKGFVLTNRSYLVNLEHIKKVEPNQVYITGNKVLPLSRRKYSDIRKKHFEWKVQRANG